MENKFLLVFSRHSLTCSCHSDLPITFIYLILNNTCLPILFSHSPALFIPVIFVLNAFLYFFVIFRLCLWSVYFLYLLILYNKNERCSPLVWIISWLFVIKVYYVTKSYAKVKEEFKNEYPELVQFQVAQENVELINLRRPARYTICRVKEKRKWWWRGSETKSHSWSKPHISFPAIV